MKRLSILVAVLTVSLMTLAQPSAGSFSLIPRLGVNFANMTNDEVVVDLMQQEHTLKSRIKPGLMVGFDAEYQATSDLFMSLGLQYSRQGSRFPDFERKDGEFVEGYSDYDALQQGTKVQTQLTGGQPFNYTFAPQTDYYLKAHLFGDIFARNNLTFAEREIVTVSAIAALPGCEPQLRAHVSGARHMGVSQQQLQQLPAVLRARVGEAEAARCAEAVAAVFGLPAEAAAPAYLSVWPRGEKNPYGQYFIGQSYLADLGAVMNVTFEPRCRNNWHVHHKQVQVLICVAGRGWYQEWGKPAVPLTPGTVIAIPAEAKHWHGAARDSWLQHLTYHKDVQQGASNEWLEPVDDEWYDKLE